MPRSRPGRPLPCRRRTGPRSASWPSRDRRAPSRAPSRTPSRRRVAACDKRTGDALVAGRGRGELGVELGGALGRVLDVVQLAAEVGCLGDDVGERRAVLLLQTLEQREAVLDLLEPRRRGVDVLRVGAQEEREVLELRLDRVARLDVGRELRVERGELADLLPHRPERRQRGVVAVVERGVGVGAQPLQAIGVREDLPRRRRAPRLRPAAASPCRSR